MRVQRVLRQAGRRPRCRYLQVRVLLEILVADYLTPGDVADRLFRIIGGHLSAPSYGIAFFDVIGVLVVARSIDSMRDDIIDDKVVGSVFLGLFVVIWLILRVFFLIFIRKDLVQPFCDRFSVSGWVFLPIYLDLRIFPVDQHCLPRSSVRLKGLRLPWGA